MCVDTYIRVYVSIHMKILMYVYMSIYKVYIIYVTQILGIQLKYNTELPANNC